MAESLVIIERDGPVALLRLNRPQARNTLNNALMDALTAAVTQMEADDEIAVMVLTGDEKAFAAGADIKEMKDKGFSDVYAQELITSNWEAPSRCRKPIIAAVAGYALGGGCELALMCDFIIASETAKFGQPEVNIGVLPGAGGSQRLTRAVGKSKAMDLCLTGRLMDAVEAERSGLVSRVVKADQLLPEAMEAAKRIAGHGRLAVYLAKEAVNAAFETNLTHGIRFERRLFHAAFATEDQKEGMNAFVEKRTPVYKGR